MLWYEHRITDRTNARYQEVMSDPTFGDTVRNIRPKEAALAAAWTGASFVMGYISGKPVRVRMGLMAAVVSGVAGFIACHRVSMQRLYGLRENSLELQRYGIEKKELVKVVKKRVVLPKEELLDI